MFYEGMTELIALYVLASGGRALYNGRSWMFTYGEELVLCRAPQTEKELQRVIRDLTAAGLPWPPITG